MSWFQNLFDAWRKIGGWRGDYNEQRRHSSLGLSYTMRIRSVDGEHELYKRRRLRPLENAAGVSHSPHLRLLEWGDVVGFY